MNWIQQQIIDLAPWHLDVAINDELSTAYAVENGAECDESVHGRVSFINPRGSFRQFIARIYPDGLEGRSFMDCACNCGGYSFWARELGAGRTFGFDVREHWINQATFLKEARGESDDVRFETADLYDVGSLGLEPFDVTLFKGIFYHLPDPITGLKVAADLTRELLVLNTATRTRLPDGMLSMAEEGSTQLMSGVYGLNWFPTGPVVLKRILRWMGFTDVRLVWWKKDQAAQETRGLGRIEIVAAKRDGLLDDFEPIGG